MRKLDMREGLDIPTLFDSNSIFTTFYDQISARSPSLLGEQEYFEALCKKKGITHILDAGCGTGRLAQQLAGPDRQVSAFDASEFFIKKFKDSLAEKPTAGPIEVSCERFDSFQSPKKFDLCIIGYYGLSYVLSFDLRRQSILNLSKCLRVGGTLVVHLPSHDLLTRVVPKQEIDAMRDTQIVGKTGKSGQEQTVTLTQQVVRFDYDATTKQTTVDFTTSLTTEGKTLLEQTHSMIYAPIDLAEMFEHAKNSGLQLVKVQQGYSSEISSEEIYEFVRCAAQ